MLVSLTSDSLRGSARKTYQPADAQRHPITPHTWLKVCAVASLFHDEQATGSSELAAPPNELNA